jgi:hypothetical protein
VSGLLLPQQSRHPAFLQHKVNALHQVLQLVEGRFPYLLVGQQRLFVWEQRYPLPFGPPLPPVYLSQLPLPLPSRSLEFILMPLALALALSFL